MAGSGTAPSISPMTWTPAAMKRDTNPIRSWARATSTSPTSMARAAEAAA
jgi:hypothetical protein